MNSRKQRTRLGELGVVNYRSRSSANSIGQEGRYRSLVRQSRQAQVRYGRSLRREGTNETRSFIGERPDNNAGIAGID